MPAERLQKMLGKVAEVRLIKVSLPQGRTIEKIAGNFADHPYTMLLLSGGKAGCARFSFLGYDPYLVIRARGDRVQVTDFHDTHSFCADPFDILDEVISTLKITPMESELPFYCGAMGYLAYDLKNHLEELPRISQDDLGLPELVMAFPRFVLACDRTLKEHHLGVTDYQPRGRKGYLCLEKRIEDFQEYISRHDRGPSPCWESANGFSSNFTHKGYLEAVKRIKSYIRQGDVYQVNLSQRFVIPFSGDSFSFFLDLFERNPAPFFAYLNIPGQQILSTSPERFIYQHGSRVETRPIKGTRPRGRTPSEDEALKRELVASAKDEAELSMIVDFMRNDLGKVCAAGSVRVREHKMLEAYTNVFHLVSVVEGELREGRGQVDLIKALFPGGSITGCPKIRAMEIIEELEPNARSVYTGSIGYISLHDKMDFNIAIRTAVIKDGRLYFSVGGGIVYDSEEEEEYQETLHKGQTLMGFLGGLSEE